MWQRDSHGLFDYESQTVLVNQIPINDSVKIQRNIDDISLISDENKENSINIIAEIQKTGRGYKIIKGNNSELWKVIDCNKKSNPDKGQILKKGDFIKIGRLKYKIKEICGNNQIIERKEKNKEKEIIEWNGKDIPVCRICYIEEEDNNPLISPCNCTGTIKYVHLSCFAKWIALKTIKKQNENCITYAIKSLSCEISNCHISSKHLSRTKGINIIENAQKEPPYLILEHYNEIKHYYNVNILIFKSKNIISIGRGNLNDVKISDISISRYHATITFKENTFILTDNNSKFGTLLKEKNLEVNLLQPELCIQVGRTLLVFQLILKPFE